MHEKDKPGTTKVKRRSARALHLGNGTDTWGSQAASTSSCKKKSGSAFLGNAPGHAQRALARSPARPPARPRGESPMIHAADAPPTAGTAAAHPAHATSGEEIELV